MGLKDCAPGVLGLEDRGPGVLGLKPRGLGAPLGLGPPLGVLGSWGLAAPWAREVGFSTIPWAVEAEMAAVSRVAAVGAGTSRGSSAMAGRGLLLPG